MIRPRKLLELYKLAALISFTTLLAFLVLNVGLFAAYEVKDRRTRPHRLPQDKLTAVYPGVDELTISELLNETWSRPYSYEPYTQFSESAFTGRYVNVSPHGFRLTRDQGPWPPDDEHLTIFIFGGSTTFGYGLPDNQTVASYLQQALSKTKDSAFVYNFGRGHYFSTQERMLFEQLLADGFRPDIAIFVDGLNDFSHPRGEPHFTRQLEDFFTKPGGLSRSLASLPVARLADSFRILARRRALRGRQVNERLLEDEAYIDAALIASVNNRYLHNKSVVEATTAGRGVETLFVWQPVPTYNYDIEHHLFRDALSPRHMHTRAGYRSMKELVARDQLGKNFLWCADLQMGIEEPLYVDAVHYGRDLTRRLATAIAEEMVRRNMIRTTPQPTKDS